MITDGRFSGGTSGLSIGHVSPEAAAGGNIGLIRNGDPIEINIPERSINLLISQEEIELRRTQQKKYSPVNRDRQVPASLQAYAMLVSSADQGAVRMIKE